MMPWMESGLATVFHGDCLDVLRGLPDNSVDAVVTDPPYGLSSVSPTNVADTITRWATGEREYMPAAKGFMGASWDGFVPPPAVWDECFRVLKPGGHMAVFAGARTQDLMGVSIRLAGFEIRDSIQHITGPAIPAPQVWVQAAGFPKGRHALKPAAEPIVIARRPLEGSVDANVVRWGTGGLNIDKSRVHAADAPEGRTRHGGGIPGNGSSYELPDVRPTSPAGRWPANVVLGEDAAEAMDQQSGTSNSAVRISEDKDEAGATYALGRTGSTPRGHTDQGGASRFFHVFKYQAKAPKRERPVVENEDGTTTQHSTVKPLSLMSWLVGLLTPPGGTVLDPFAGSGTTLEAATMEGHPSIGIEAHDDYLPLIRVRLDRADRVERNLFTEDT